MQQTIIAISMLSMCTITLNMQDITTFIDNANLIRYIFITRPESEVYGDHVPRYSHAFMNAILQKEGHNIWNVECEFYTNLIECAMKSVEWQRAHIKEPTSSLSLRYHLKDKQYCEQLVVTEHSKLILSFLHDALQVERTKSLLALGRRSSGLRRSSLERVSLIIKVPAWVIVTCLQWALPGTEILEDEDFLSGGSEAGVARIRFENFGQQRHNTLTFGINSNDHGSIVADAPPMWRHPDSTFLFDIIQHYDQLYDYFNQNGTLPDTEQDLYGDCCTEGCENCGCTEK
jgi:hypothetical protein